MFFLLLYIKMLNITDIRHIDSYIHGGITTTIKNKTKYTIKKRGVNYVVEWYWIMPDSSLLHLWRCFFKSFEKAKDFVLDSNNL